MRKQNIHKRPLPSKCDTLLRPELFPNMALAFIKHPIARIRRYAWLWNVAITANADGGIWKRKILQASVTIIAAGLKSDFVFSAHHASEALANE